MKNKKTSNLKFKNIMFFVTFFVEYNSINGMWHMLLRTTNTQSSNFAFGYKDFEASSHQKYKIK